MGGGVALEDARRDVAPELADAMIERYLLSFPNIDRAAFLASYAVLGAQRNCKIVGIFTRLLVRDGKPQYLKHIPRVWRLIDEIVQRAAPPGSVRPNSFGSEAESLRRAGHKTLHSVGRNIEGLRFNVAVAQLYEFTNTLGSPVQRQGEGIEWALREAAELLVQMIGPMMPHLAEECWARLGYHTILADQPWPTPEPALLVDDTVTIAVQVNGKRRDELTISRTASPAEVEAAALELDSVVRALEGRPVKKVIVVPQRIVNVVT